MKIVKPTPTCPEDEAYIAYIDEHRKNVYTAFIRFGHMICLAMSLVHGEYDMLRRYVYSHDASKYTEEEFFGYRQWFFPEKDKEANRDLFNKAWVHHYTVNPHHWEFHVKNGIPKEMSKLNTAEMLLDWIAMSIKFKNSPVTWYNEHKNNINIHKNTRNTVEAVLAILSAQKLYPFVIRKKKRIYHRKDKNDVKHV